MTKLRYPFGGGDAVRHPCAVCTGAAHECSTEPAKQLPILGRRHTHNDERNSTGTALAGDKLGADYRLYAESGRQHAPGGQHRRRVGSCADVRTDAKTQPRFCDLPIWLSSKRRWCRYIHNSDWQKALQRELVWWNRKRIQRRKPAHAHREQVHGCVYVPSNRLTPKGVAV